MGYDHQTTQLGLNSHGYSFGLAFEAWLTSNVVKVDEDIRDAHKVSEFDFW